MRNPLTNWERWRKLVTFVVTHGTDSLAGVHVEGTGAVAATGPATFAGTYTGQVTLSG